MVLAVSPKILPSGNVKAPAASNVHLCIIPSLAFLFSIAKCGSSIDSKLRPIQEYALFGPVVSSPGYTPQVLEV